MEATSHFANSEKESHSQKPDAAYKQGPEGQRGKNSAFKTTGEQRPGGMNYLGNVSAATSTQKETKKQKIKKEMTETTHVCTHRLAKPREELRIYHTLSPTGMAERRWNTRYSAYAWLYADNLFCLCWFSSMDMRS